MLIIDVEGRLMAHEILFIVYARTLAVFNISKYVENGIIIEPSLDRSDGVVRYVCFIL